MSSCTSSLPAFFTGCVDSLEVTSSVEPFRRRLPVLPLTPVTPGSSSEPVSSSHGPDQVTSSCPSELGTRRVPPYSLPQTPVTPEAVSSSYARSTVDQVTSSCHPTTSSSLGTPDTCLLTPNSQVSCSAEAVSSSWTLDYLGAASSSMEGMSRRRTLQLPPPCSSSEADSSTQSDRVLPSCFLPSSSEAVSNNNIPPQYNRVPFPAATTPLLRRSLVESIQSKVVSSQLPLLPPGDNSPCASDASSTQSKDSGVGSASPGNSARESPPPPSHPRRGVKRQLVLDSPQTNGLTTTSPPAKRRQLPAVADDPPELLSPLLPPPPPNLAFLGSDWEQVSKDMYEYFERHRQQEAVYLQKMNLRDALYNVLQKTFQNCKLYVVGSSMNGLGTNSSDMDMCLMLPHQEMNQDHQATVLGYVLKEIAQCEYVVSPVLIRAKVPILKFLDKVSGVEVDLNINNCVGIRNTQLLNSYSRLDWRVKPLVLVVKSWAKAYNINDAKNMTLSSYSLVLMVIHYLQCGCQPPVLPSLQEIQPDKFHPDSDISQLVLMEKLPQFESHNTLNLGELFIGFLEYFSRRFDYKNEAISIRLGRTLPKRICVNYVSPKNKRGMWKLLSIEEPFDRTNTARSVYDVYAFNRICWSFDRSYELLNRTRDLFSILPSA